MRQMSCVGRLSDIHVESSSSFFYLKIKRWTFYYDQVALLLFLNWNVYINSAKYRDILIGTLTPPIRSGRGNPGKFEI